MTGAGADSLFAFAVRQAQRGALKDIAYSADLGYPTRILAGTPNPDDGFSSSVSALVALP